LLPVSSAFASSFGILARGRSLMGGALFALALPVFALQRWSGAYADSLGIRIAGWLTAVVPVPAPPTEEGGPGELDELDESEPPFDNAPGAQAVAVDSKRPRPPGRARVAKGNGIRVSAAQVLALSARRAMPHAVFVKANAQRPAGLLLSGVSALGVGVQDGDVLTEAAGQKASSVAQVVGLVLAARARQAAEISGRFYRGSVPFSITVEQPYPKGPVPG